MSIYIPSEIQEEIKRITEHKLEEVMGGFVKFGRQGTAGLKCDCHSCGRSGQTLQFNPRKRIAKCFHCEASASSPVNYLTRFEGMNYNDALIYLADRYDIDIKSRIEQQNDSKREKVTTNISFRDSQLLSSGIPDKQQKWMLRVSSTTEIVKDRYEKGTINHMGEVDYGGDDLLLHYLDLEGNPIMYQTKGGKKKALLRIRYQFPDQHTDQDGNPIKYRSPYGSGSQLWLPQATIQAYQQGIPHDTLIVTEGEKKAEKLAIEGNLTVGIMGIHNFNARGEMPHYFFSILKKNNISNVVFLLDTDWQDLSIKAGKPVDQRSRQFFSAVKKFRDYFYGFAPEFEVRIFFGHHISKYCKGVDDYIVHDLKGRENDFKEAIKAAIINREHKNEYLQLHDITTISDYRLSEFWQLHSPAAFIDTHKDKLVKMKEFELAGLKRRVNDDGEIELAQKLLPHEQFWIINDYGPNKNAPSYSFDYLQINYFLKNRGFGLYKPQHLQFRMIQSSGKVVRDVDHHLIQHFVKDFSAELDIPEKKDIQRMLLRGMTQYMGPDKLANMDYLFPAFYTPEKEVQYLFFKTKYVKITRDEIIIDSINNIPFHVWENQIIDFEPKIVEDFFDITRDRGHFKMNARSGEDDNPGPFYRSDICQFLYRTSLSMWKNFQKLVDTKNGNKKWIGKDDQELIPTRSQDIHDTFDHLAAKIIALGYLLNDYNNKAEKKAIIAMDMVETEVGLSQGGTGKSLYSTMVEKVVPTFIVDGKQQNLNKDDHLYEGVDERTRVIVFDDCRVNFDFEFLFSQITRGVTVNPKGKKKFTLPSPKFILNTNHAFNGEGNSFARRQYYVAFGDYYNEHRTPEDDFGHLLFDDWDFEQWNLFYNLIFKAIQLYFRFGLKFTIPVQNIESRKLRQRMGENFLEWATSMWTKAGEWLNNEVEKKLAYDSYIQDFPEDRRYVNLRQFKKKVLMYAAYSGLEYNPQRNGDTIKSGNNEYLCLADSDFKATKATKISDNIPTYPHQ